jgi:hypothetical protein
MQAAREQRKGGDRKGEACRNVRFFPQKTVLLALCCCQEQKIRTQNFAKKKNPGSTSE